MQGGTIQNNEIRYNTILTCVNCYGTRREETKNQPILHHFCGRQRKQNISFFPFQHTPKARLPTSTALRCTQLTSGLEMGVRESHPRSRSIFLRLRLSTITTSCPCSDKYKEVGHPQKPSPPKTTTFFFSADDDPFSAYTAVDEAGVVVLATLLRLRGEKAVAIGTITVNAVNKNFILSV